MNNYIITITRQFGSLGRPIAGKLAEILGIEYYDRDIVEKAAKEMGENIKVVSEEEEKADGSFAWMKIPFGIATSEKQDAIFDIERSVIEKFALQRSCIIVGRCADAILSDRKNAVHVFIYAPFEERLRNCVDILKMDEKEARKTIKEVDKMRDAYHKRYAGFLPADPEHKNILIDSSMLGVNGTAKYLADLVNLKFKLDEDI